MTPIAEKFIAEVKAQGEDSLRLGNMKCDVEEYGVSCDTGDDDNPWRVLLALMLHVRGISRCGMN